MDFLGTQPATPNSVPAFSQIAPANNAITNAKLAQAPTMTVHGNNSAATANVANLTMPQLLSMLNAYGLANKMFLNL